MKKHMTKYQVNVIDWSRGSIIPEKMEEDLKTRRSDFITNSGGTEESSTVHYIYGE